MIVRTVRLVSSFLIAVLLIVLALIALQSSSIAQAASPLFVAPGGSDTANTCDANSTPCATLQHAVDVAASGAEIRVATGSYTDIHVRPINDFTTTGVVTQMVYISKSITIRGGFTASNWNTPNSTVNPTTLNAQGQGRVFYLTGNNLVTIDGLRITNGNAAGLGGREIAGYDLGGGLYAYHTPLMLTNNFIYSNALGSNGDGSGVGIAQAAAVISNNRIVSNTAGAALLLLSKPAHAATTWHVTKLADTNDGLCNADCSLREAISAAGSGDTIDFDVTGTIVLSLGELTVNTPLSIAGPGAALLIINGNDATRIFNLNASTALSGMTIFNANATGGSGGGIIINSGAITITQSTVFSNTTAGYGGGIYLSGGSLFITHSLVSSNAAAPFSGKGGGLYVNAGLVSIVNSTVSSNTSSGGFDPGGGVYNNGGTLTISSSTFSGNNSYYSFGGAIDNNSGILTIDNSTFSTNTAANGGAISNGSVMTVTASNFISNTGTYNTAAIGNDSIARLSDVTIRGNTAGILTSGWGGGIRNSGSLVIANSTLNGNVALGNSAYGGGIDNSGQLTMTNSTISGNTANGTGSRGGGLYTFITSTVDLNFVTIAQNSAGTGGGGGMMANSSTGTITGPATIKFKNTLIAYNTTTGSGADCTTLSGGTIDSQDYNLIQNTSSCTITNLNGTDITGQDPRLSPLQKNGGSTQTHGLFVSSPAMDKIPNATNGCGTTITTDQRNTPRPVNGACDMGAFEGTLYPVYLPLALK